MPIVDPSKDQKPDIDSRAGFIRLDDPSLEFTASHLPGSEPETPSRLVETRKSRRAAVPAVRLASTRTA
jgi:hypothetical protein